MTDHLTDDHTLRLLVETYLAAFATPSPADQERLLRASVADHIAYSNPGVSGNGLPNLLAHIGGFQRKFAGGRFRLNWLRAQHGQGLVEWTQLDAQGQEVLTAHSYVRVNEAGQLTHWAGFWSVGAV